MIAYIECLARNGSYQHAIVNVASGAILLHREGYAMEDLPQYKKEFTGTAAFYQIL